MTASRTPPADIVNNSFNRNSSPIHRLEKKNNKIHHKKDKLQEIEKDNILAGILKCPWRHTGLSGQIWQTGPRDQVVPLDTRRALARPEFGDKTLAGLVKAIIR